MHFFLASFGHKSHFELSLTPSIRDENDQKSSKLILQIQKGSERYGCIATTLCFAEKQINKMISLLALKQPMIP